MTIRLQHGGAYASDISALCAQIRANGTNAVLAAVPVTHPLAPGVAPVLHINLAYEPNSNLPPINGSIYTVAITNPNGTWHFNVGAIGVAVPGVVFPGALNGSYQSLGYGNPPALPPISDANLLAAVNAVNNYAGAAPVPAAVLDGLTRLIIAVSEAARFGPVSAGISTVLGNANVFVPPDAMIRAWGGHSLSA